jgi:hypothetical protein
VPSRACQAARAKPRVPKLLAPKLLAPVACAKPERIALRSRRSNALRIALHAAHQGRASMRIARAPNDQAINAILTMICNGCEFKGSLSFLDHYSFQSIFMDFEWLLSTLFDASLLLLRAAGNGGSFLFQFGAFPAASRLPFSK